MKKIYLSLLFIALVNLAIAQVKHTVTKSTITFQIKNLGFNIGGNFSGLQANIQFDPANLPNSVIEASANANTINTDNDMRDEHLKSDSYFDVEKYPKITMKSVSFKHRSGDNYSGQFNLTIKDKTQLIDMPFTYTSTGNAASFKSSIKLKRSNFGIGGSSMTMSDDLTVFIDVETSK